MFPGDKMPKMPYLEKMANGSHFRGTMSNVMAKKSTETNFKYKKDNEWNLFSKTLKMFPADKMQKVALSRENGIMLSPLGPNFKYFYRVNTRYHFQAKIKELDGIFHKSAKNVSLGQKPEIKLSCL